MNSDNPLNHDHIIDTLMNGFSGDVSFDTQIALDDLVHDHCPDVALEDDIDDEDDIGIDYARSE